MWIKTYGDSYAKITHPFMKRVLNLLGGNFMKKMLTIIAIILVNLLLGYCTGGLWFIYIIFKGLCRYKRTFVVNTVHYKKR